MPDGKVYIQYDGKSIVTAGAYTRDFNGDFDAALRACDIALKPYRTYQRSGSEWGCDGVGYIAEKPRGYAFRHMSGIGPRNFKKVV